jgi:TetR/AcrR family transcriptional repressor of bet genes
MSITKRNLSKAERRQQLIKATIRCVARSGLSATTMAEVTKEAGLSLGIVNLHFQSKEKLLVETLRFVAHEYQAEWRKVLDLPGDPETRIARLIELDYSARVCQREKLAVWFAFWGEARSRPTYRRICADVDREYVRVVQQICDEICELDAPLAVDTEVVAYGYAALTDGLWLDLLISPRDMTRVKARQISLDYFASHFPGRFVP